MQNYDVTIEIFEAIHKEWDLFKKLYDNTTITIFVGPSGTMPGNEGVVCNICTGLGAHPASVLLRTKDGTLDDKGKALLDNFVSKIRKQPRLKVYSI